MYRAITIKAGSSGWGGPLTIQPTEKRNKILSVTGGGIDPVAQKIADMTGGIAVDGFTGSAPDDEILVAVVDCGGTARCGVYPKKKIFTVNLMAVGKSGPLAQFITEDIYVSDVSEKCLSFADGSAPIQTEAPAAAGGPKSKEQAKKEVAEMQKGKNKNIISRMGIAVGQIVNKFFAAGRETIDMVIKNILPFMAFTATIIGIINATGLGTIIANTISPMCSSLIGMLIISIICALPFLSPILGPGGVIAQVVGVLLGTQIGLGNIPAQYALPALFAINSQCGCDFVPVGLSLGEANADTIELGVPAVLFSRLITGPLATLIAFGVAMLTGLYA
jgi:PTS system glucitol/sorbitol-specific IIC component